MTNIDRRTFLTHVAGGVALAALLPSLTPASPRSGSEPVNVAVIGLGSQGRSILEELQKIEGCRVVALCDTLAPRVQDAMKLVLISSVPPNTQGFTDYKDLFLNVKDLSAVIIATPTHLHKDIALAAIAQGLNVYCEAPLAHTIEDARAIAHAAKKSKALFQPGLHARCNPLYRHAQSYYHTESFGTLVSARAQHHEQTSWRSPRETGADEKALNWKLDRAVSLGLAGELGTHQFDVLNYFTDKVPVSVRASGSLVAHDDGRDVFDTIHCDFAFADKAHFQYNATIANSFEGRQEVIHGTGATYKLAWTNAWIFKEADSPPLGFETYATRQQFHKDEGIILIADATKLAAQGELKEGVGLPYSPLHYALAEFITAIADKKPSPVTPEEGLRATVLGILANRAITTGETVTIDPKLLEL